MVGKQQMVISRQICVSIKEYVINSIVGSSQREWLTLSATSREIDSKPRISVF